MIVELTRPEAEAQEPAQQEAENLRRCLASGESKPKAELIRFVVSPDGLAVPDLAEKLPGRGLWLSLDYALACKAVRAKLFSRAAKQSVQVAEDLPDRLAELLKRRALDGLGLAKRAGLVAAGHDKVRSRLERGQVRLLLQACDGAEEPRKKMWNFAQAQSPGVELFEPFLAEELGAALGREPCVHVVVDRAGMSRKLAEDLARWQGYEATRQVVEK